MLCIIESFAKSLNAFLEPVGNGPIRQTAHEFLLVLHSNYNNNNNKHDNVYGAVIMADPLREFTRFI